MTDRPKPLWPTVSALVAAVLLVSCTGPVPVSDAEILADLETAEWEVWLQGTTPDALALLRTALEHPSPRVRTAAANWAARAALPQVVPLLRDAYLVETEPLVRRDLVWASGRVVQASLVNTDIEDLVERASRDPDPGVRSALLLGFSRHPALAGVVERLVVDPSADVRSQAAFALVRNPALSYPDAFRRLGGAEHDEHDEKVRWAILRAILSNPSIVAEGSRDVAPRILDRNHLVSVYAVSTLPFLDSPCGIEETLILVREKTLPWVARTAGVRALVRLLQQGRLDQTRESVEHYLLEAVAAARDGDAVRPDVLEAIEGLGACESADADEWVRRLLSRDDPEVVARVIRGLAVGATTRAQPPRGELSRRVLRDFRADPRAPVRVERLRLASRIGAREHVRAAVSDNSPEVRAAATSVLEADESHWLLKAAEDQDGRVQLAAVERLAELASGQLPAALEAVSPRTLEWPARLRLVDVVARLEAPGRDHWLATLAGDPSPSVRRRVGQLTGQALSPLSVPVLRPYPLWFSGRGNPHLWVDLEAGSLLIELYTDAAPHHASLVLECARRRLYDGEFLVSSDPLFGFELRPKSDTEGLSGCELPPEPSARPVRSGTLVEPPSSPGGGHLCIATLPLVELEGRVAVLGRVVRGLDALERGTRARVISISLFSEWD